MTIASEQVITAPQTGGVVSPAGALVKPTGTQLLAAFPPRPLASSWPATEASRSAVLARVLGAPFTLDNAGSQQTRRLGVLAVLSWHGALFRQKRECPAPRLASVPPRRANPRFSRT
jgi:hypothetical protein